MGPFSFEFFSWHVNEMINNLDNKIGTILYGLSSLLISLKKCYPVPPSV